MKSVKCGAIVWLVLIFALPQIAAARQRVVIRSVPGVPLQSVPAGDLSDSSGEITIEPNQEQPSSASAGAVAAEDQEQQKVQLLVSAPFTRPAAQLLQAWLLGPEVAFALAENDTAKQAPSAARMVPPPKLAVPGEKVEFQFAAPGAAQEQLQAEVAQFRRNVTLGNWRAVQDAIAAMTPENGKQVYEHLLNSFAGLVAGSTGNSPQPVAETEMSYAVMRGMRSGQSAAMGGMPMQQFQVSPNYITPSDVLAIADISPTEFSEPQLSLLANVLRVPIQSGFELEPLIAQLKAGTRWLGGEDAVKRIAAAKLMLTADQPKLAGEFLPSFEALDRGNAEQLKIYGQRALRLFAKDGKLDWLQQAWECNQAVVNIATASVKDKNAALEQLVLLAPKIKREIGQAWLDASFQNQAELGREILSLLGSKTASGLAVNPGDAAARTEWLRLQTKALESLLAKDSTQRDVLQPAITLLAMNWLKEAQTSVNNSALAGGQPYMQVDMYGNYYWVDPNQMQQMNRQANGELMPIGIRDLISIRPNEQWIDSVDPSLQLAIPKMTAHLFLKVNDEREAFPQIEKVAQRDPPAAQLLVDEFLTTWTLNHDPNMDQRQRNPYIYFYGFDVKADSIPLTRSKQERNLAELSEWVGRIRQMPVEKVDEAKLATAFTTCHSSAEVFKLDAIESVFGPVESLKPETVASICQTMRGNLATVWRNVREQEQKQTKRREPEVQQEVLRGYAVATEFATRALQTAPDNWQLTLALACLAHDQNDYAQSVTKSSEYSARRQAAFDQFALAAKKYSATVSGLERNKQSTEVFDDWFYAALGAVDLGKITDETVAAPAQYPLIRQALLDLPGEVAEEHLANFANNLFTRMSPIKPEMKFRYLSGGFEVVGDHPRAAEARKLFQYYQDLLAEIKLVADIDGSAVVGHDHPFGVFVNIYHTHEIERESSGFAKYVQNQNNMMYAYNYGRPNEDYREKFEKALRDDLSEHFEVLGVTFENPKTIRSRPAPESGWRVTPYAYLLLKPLGPQVDKLPTIKLNLDFLDTSGFVIMPIATPIVPIDSASPQEPRPYQELNVVQTLDERQAADGKLILEIKGTAKGLVPELDQLLELKFDHFEVHSIDAQTVLANEFDPESEEIRVSTDRSWTVQLRAIPGEEPPEKFQFAALRDVQAVPTYQRYKDADLVKVDRVAALEKSYAARDLSYLWWLIPLAGALVLAIVALAVRAGRRTKSVVAAIQLPSDINPFTVIALLKAIKHRNHISARDVPALDQSIVDLETFYFGQRNGHPEPDLDHIARAWVAKSN